MEKNNKLKPISIWKSIILFGIPGLLIYVGLVYGAPYFQKIGLKIVFLFPFFLWIPIIPLLPISILLFKKEKKDNPKLKISERFRLKTITKNDWLWTISGIIFVFVFEILMEPVAKWMASKAFFSAPDHFPLLLHPLKEIKFPLSEFLGVNLRGNWIFLIATIMLHSTAMIAEEFMWRGYILPRQEVKYGNYAWLVNGLLWAYLVHLVMPWNFIAFLPSMLITPFIAQKTKNTWVALMIHGIPNTILWILILSGITGVG
ncbi:MAG: CPBP family intramembrane metalloprotease [Bacteroidetes bacterium]|nr:CPBP family intramembrane metalloprotease [Bacteroidota bacterium]